MIGIWKNLYNGFFSKTGMRFYPSPFTFLPGMPIKTGDLRMTSEGCFYVIASMTIYISSTYAWRVKGEGLLSFRFSNFQWFYPQIRYPIGRGLEFFFILLPSEGIKIEPFRSRKAMQRAVAWWSLPYEHDRHRLDEGDLYPSCWTSGHQRHK